MARVPSWIAMEEYADVTLPVLDQMGEVLEISRDEGDVEKLMDEGDALQSDLENVNALKEAVVNADEISEPAEEIATVAAESFCNRWGISVKRQIAMESYRSGNRRRGLIVALEAAEESIWQTIKRWFRELIAKIKKFFSGLFSKSESTKKEVIKAKNNVSQAKLPKRIAFKPQPVYKASAAPKTEEEISKASTAAENTAAQEEPDELINFDDFIVAATMLLKGSKDNFVNTIALLSFPVATVERGINNQDAYNAAMGSYDMCYSGFKGFESPCNNAEVQAWIKSMESAHSGYVNHTAFPAARAGIAISQKDNLSPVAFDVFISNPPKCVIGDSAECSPEEVRELTIGICDALSITIKKTDDIISKLQKSIDAVDIEEVRKQISVWAGADTDKLTSGIVAALKQHSTNLTNGTRYLVSALNVTLACLNGYLATIA